MTNHDFYKNGKIYKIVCNITGDQYIGSTCKSLTQRLANHRSAYKQLLNDNKKNYTTSFKILEKNDYNIILLEDYPCNNKEQLNARERHYIETLECVNKQQKLNRTKIDAQEYRKLNHEKINEQIKKYKEDNRELILSYHQNYYENNKEKLLNMMMKKVTCDCGCIYSIGHRTRHFKTKKHLLKINNSENNNKISI
jgi:hypothetical protein